MDRSFHKYNPTFNPIVHPKNEQKYDFRAARVLIIGAGGLGTPVATYLAASGIGFLGIMDGDRVESSNLNRQFLYTQDDIGKNKAELIAHILGKQNPTVHIKPFCLFLNEENAYDIVNNFDIVCDCTDTAFSRILINKICSALKKPLVFAAINDWEGYIAVLHYKKSISLLDIFSEKEITKSKKPTIIMNALCGITGSIQAMEVLKIIINAPDILDGEILCLNSMHHQYKKYKVKKIPTV